jgi:CRISPR-associated protein Cmr3
MSETVVRITTRDPLLFGDGRPFTNEDGAYDAITRNFPLPGVVAGMLRTRIGNALGWNWGADDVARALNIPVAGPLLAGAETILFPAPGDALIYSGSEKELRLEGLRPYPTRGTLGALPQDAGCDLPSTLTPLCVPTCEKAQWGADYWPADLLWEWLMTETPRAKPLPAELDPARMKKRNPIHVETRTHLQMDPETGLGKAGHLFTTQGIALRPGYSFLARFDADRSVKYGGLAPLGGERRLAEVEVSDSGLWPLCPVGIRESLSTARAVRMQLVTPAIFAGGWKPGWLGDRLEGSPPFASRLVLRLVAVAARRRDSVSGWDIAKGRPKAVRWLVPAGSVYFFEVVGGEPAVLTETAWLAPVCDEPQDRRDGYGLAAWGVWA